MKVSIFADEVKLERGDFEVGIRPSRRTGWFEWVGGDNEDDEVTGGLWFHEEDGCLELEDYDGVFALPKEVKDILRDAGVAVNEEF